jgi:[ribosomal protein S5]-alanine N-acetyltransferase
VRQLEGDSCFMASQPALTTERLILRPLTLEDAPIIQQLAGKREIADTTISIPHPYSEQQARDWISSHADACVQGKGVAFGVELTHTNQLIGAVGLREIDQEHLQAEMGFWIGTDWWGKGYATEAAKRVIRFGFKERGLNRIYAHHMVRNPASGRVLEKSGMRGEGLLRQRVRKWGRFEDVVILAILRKDWENAQPTAQSGDVP